VSWRVVAEKDFRDGIRSRWLWGLSLFFVAFIAGSTALFYTVTGSGEGGATSKDLFGLFAGAGFLSFSYTGLLAFALVFIALITSYASVVGERDSGTLKLLLSLPHSRRDVVVGKVLGRSVVVVAPVLLGFLVAAVVMVVVGVRVNFGTYLPQVLLTALLAVVFVAVGVGLSASAGTSRRATLTAFGLYFLFSVLWASVPSGAVSLVNEVRKALGMETIAAATRVKLQLFLKHLNPLRAYETLVAQVYFAADAASSSGSQLPPDVQARILKAGFGTRIVIQEQGLFADSLPIYLSTGFMFVVLLTWGLLPPLLGFLAFDDADL
jgi:ABC-2 type transport system permease protein